MEPRVITSPLFFVLGLGKDGPRKGEDFELLQPLE
jgi:hypothetical protein